MKGGHILDVSMRSGRPLKTYWSDLSTPLFVLITVSGRQGSQLLFDRRMYINGSWKNIPVTLGKGLDLKFGPMGLCTNVETARGYCGEICGPSRRSFGGVEDKSFGGISLSQ